MLARVRPTSWGDLTYLLLIAINSTFMCSILYLIGADWREVVAPFKTQAIRLIVLIPLAAEFFWIYGLRVGLIATFDSLVLLEFIYRTRESWTRTIVAITLPLVYFFAGFLLVYYYNDIVVSFRFYGTYDEAFQSLDRGLLFGHTVSGISKWVTVHAPIAISAAESVYLWLFGQVGIGIFFAAVEGGLSRSLRLVGTILLAYYIALVCFYLWPSQGPYYLCLDHFTTFPSSLQSYAIQKTMLDSAQAIWNHSGIVPVRGDYFISFPCMHIGQPLIVLWFLRHWKRIPIILIAYDVVLVAAILLLEWHYLVDIFGGIAISIAAIWITEGNPAKLLHYRPATRNREHEAILAS